MTYSRKEMMAIYKMAKAMSLADGHAEIEELALIAKELANFGALDESLINESDAMEAGEAIIALSNMTLDEKRYVCGFLAAVMAVNGVIEDKELALWQLVSTLAQFPKMSIAEALDFWKNN